jgi:beta-lactamase superfamily II metal-dependent hydrolase
MDLKIFDVEHGACALLTCDNLTRILIDCGHNGDTGWRPGPYLNEQGIYHIEMLINSNYDEDHVSGLPTVLRHVRIGNLLRNPTVTSDTLRFLKSEDGMGVGVATLATLIGNHFTAPATVGTATFQGLRLYYFYNQYPYFDDENNLSLVTFLECQGIGILFPGDLGKR